MYELVDDVYATLHVAAYICAEAVATNKLNVINVNVPSLK